MGAYNPLKTALDATELKLKQMSTTITYINEKK